MTQEDFTKRLSSINCNLEIIGRINGVSNKIRYKCSICGYEGEKIVSDILNGIGCPKCSKRLKLTQIDFENRVKEINRDIKIVGKYKNMKSYIKCYCLKCGLEYNSIAKNVIEGHGCPRCAGKYKKNHNEFIYEMQKINPNLKILNMYENSKSIIKYKCLKCGYENEVRANGLLRGYGCPKCKGVAKYTQKEFENIIEQKNKNIKILGKYNGKNKRIKCKCLICENEWETKASNLIRGRGCPNCKFSNGEEKIKNVLNENNIKYESQKKYFDLLGTNGGQLSYDFYISDYNLLIEYQGIQHEVPIDFFGGKEKFKKQKEHDRRKKEYAKEHNIQLLEIWYNENIEQKLKETLNLETVETTGV